MLLNVAMISRADPEEGSLVAQRSNKTILLNNLFIESKLHYTKLNVVITKDRL